MITIVDYGRGNLFSLRQALMHVGAPVALATEADQVLSAEKLILPGVGAFGDAVQGLADRGLKYPVIEAANRGTPLLGICVGMQMLVSTGEEFGEHPGLGLVKGRTVRLPDADSADADRIPNVGWRKVRPGPGAGSLGLKEDMSEFYFVHSYAPVMDDSTHIAGDISFNGHDIAVAICRNNVAGVQFHPEKSGSEGLMFLKNFVENF